MTKMSRSLSRSKRKFAAKSDFFCWFIWVLATLMFVGADEAGKKLVARTGPAHLLETLNGSVDIFPGQVYDPRMNLSAFGNGWQLKDVSEQNQGARAMGVIPRLDVLNGFRKYHGGFNVIDKHYWTSVVFTGVWAYSLAVICLAYGLVHAVLLLCTCLCGCCKLRHQNEQLRTLQLCIVFFFAFLAMAGALSILFGNVKLGTQLQETTNVVVNTVNNVLRDLNQLLIFIERATAPIDSQDITDQVLAACNMMNDTAHYLDELVQNKQRWLFRIFADVKIALTVIATVVTFSVLAGIGATYFRYRLLILLLFLFMLLLLFCSWMVAGISFVLSNVASDACAEMRQYDEDPATSSLSELLPCLPRDYAEDTLIGARSAIKTLINQTNNVIDEINAKEENLANDRNETQPRLTLEHVCDPYGSAPFYDDQNCTTSINDFRNFSKDYAIYRCINDTVDYCFDNDTPIPNTAFIELSIAMNASRDVYSTLPTLVGIMTCSFVRPAFEVLVTRNCKPLDDSLHLLWAGFILAAVAMMPLQVTWPMIYNCLPSNRVTPSNTQ